ncbi:MAG: hypothetical protein ABIO63_08970 [Casimicrobiaceae bacterium]
MKTFKELKEENEKLQNKVQEELRNYVYPIGVMKWPPTKVMIIKKTEVTKFFDEK